MFDEISLILWSFGEAGLQEKERWRCNQLEEYRIDLGAAMNDANKKLNIAPEKKDFAKAVSRFLVVEILLKLL